MRRLLILGISTLILVAPPAQAGLGFSAGASLSNFHFTKTTGDRWRARFAVRFGVFAEFFENELFPFRVELLYSGKGATAVGTYLGQEARARQYVTYLEIPLTWSFRLWTNEAKTFDVRVFAGGYGALKIGTRSELVILGETTDDGAGNLVRNLDWGGVAGVRSRWGRLFLDLRFGFGFADLRKDTAVGPNTRNAGWALQVGSALF